MEKVDGLDWATANAIKKARIASGFTQSQLAGFAGLSEVYLAKLEQGACGISLDALVQIAAAFGMQPSELMKEIEMELASGSSKPEGTRGRPRQCRKPGRKKSAA
jgi:transcriptional regulator with XRE-family HTH domain